jgi:DHA1 family multidrug resistance protein-like MFS transporter
MPSWKRTLALMVGAQFTASLGFSVVFPFLPFYVAQLGSISNLSIEMLSGLIYASPALTMAIASPFWGAMADRRGRKPMVLRATFGGAVMFLLMGFVVNAEQLVALRVLQGLVTGILAAASALIVSVTPREHTGYAMGWLQVGLWSGNAAGPVLGGVLSDLTGYRAIFMVTAALLALSGLGVWLGVEEPFVREPGRGTARAGISQGWRRILADPRLCATLTLRFLTSLGRSTLAPILPLFVLHVTRGSTGVGTLTGLITGVESATSTLSAVYLGRLGDRIGHGRVALASALVTAACYVPQGFVDSVWLLLLLQGLSGLGVGGLLPSLSALLAQYSRLGEEGSVYGIENSVMSAARGIAPLLAAGCALWFSLGGAFLLTAAIFAAVALVASLTVCRPRPADLPPSA